MIVVQTCKHSRRHTLNLIFSMYLVFNIITGSNAWTMVIHALTCFPTERLFACDVVPHQDRDWLKFHKQQNMLSSLSIHQSIMCITYRYSKWYWWTTHKTQLFSKRKKRVPVLLWSNIVQTCFVLLSIFNSRWIVCWRQWCYMQLSAHTIISIELWVSVWLLWLVYEIDEQTNQYSTISHWHIWTWYKRLLPNLIIISRNNDFKPWLS